MKLKIFFAGVLSTFIILTANPAFAAYEDDGEIITEVPTDIYMWVQSTPRGNYWFNHKAAGYKIREDGTLDLNTLMVPTVCMYDNIQIEDVIQKRRWKRLSLKGYDRLAGRADYLKFDLLKCTVQVVERVDLDDTWAALDKDTSCEPIDLKTLPSTDLRYNFYRTILQWAKDHNELIIGRSKGRLSEEDGDLPLNEVPINKIFISSASYENTTIATKTNFVKDWDSLNIKNEPVEYNGEKFNRVLVIGDVHGKFNRFMSMYEKLGVTDSDLVIFLGDYINGKPAGEDLKTVKWLMIQSKKKNFILLSGNMERNFLAECFDDKGKFKKSSAKDWTLAKELRDANSPKLDKEVYDFFSGLKFYLELNVDDKNFVFAHAGIKDGTPLDKQEEFSLMFNKEFYEEYDGEKIIVIGHIPVQKAFGENFTVPIKVAGKNILMTDTRCKQAEGYSSCVNILTGEFWQSEKDW